MTRRPINPVNKEYFERRKAARLKAAEDLKPKNPDRYGVMIEEYIRNGVSPKKATRLVRWKALKELSTDVDYEDGYIGEEEGECF